LCLMIVIGFWLAIYVSHGAEPRLKVMKNGKWKQQTGLRI